MLDPFQHFLTIVTTGAMVNEIQATDWFNPSGGFNPVYVPKELFHNSSAQDLLLWPCQIGVFGQVPTYSLCSANLKEIRHLGISKTTLFVKIQSADHLLLLLSSLQMECCY